MPSSDPPTSAEPPLAEAPAVIQSRPQPQSQGKGGEVKGAKTQDTAAPIDAKKPTGAELKAKAKAEKAARRAQVAQEKQASAAVPTVAPLPGPALKIQAQAGGKAQQRRAGSNAAETRNLPVRAVPKAAVAVPEMPVKEDKKLEYLRTLYKPRTISIARASKEVHPAVLALGLHMSNYTICGSCARLVATLQAFKRVIESYTTPPGNTLTRHLTSHILSPQIAYLTSCRPISISMGNAIRWLKLQISKIDIDVPEAEAKKGLCEAVDVFIRERVTFSDQVIAQSAAERIGDGDVIMTYAKSSNVQRALVKAHEEGKKFQVIAVDSGPLHEGRHLAAALADLGMDVKYTPINGTSHYIQDVTKVFLGAHAMMNNGRLLSRAGTAVVAMMANDADKPVIVLCETVKFSDRSPLDSIALNEIARADEMVSPGGPLENWRDVKKLQLCNLMYDVTPSEYIQMIITEAGSVPTSSVPVLHRLGNESQ